MSGPGGSVTKRDKRRETRREQLQQRQLERQRERQRQLRNQRIRLGAFIGVPILVLLAIILSVAVIGHNNTPTTTKGGLAPAHGQTVDGMDCLPSEGGLIHNHAYLEIYVDGKGVTVPPGLGIVYPQGTGVSALASDGLKSCLYPLHVHDQEPNIIHIESPVQKSYFLGEVFDLWGQQLTSTQVMAHKADATNKLVFEVFDASGKMTTVTTDPRQIELTAHETVAILYNSPNVSPKPYTDWNGL